MKEWSGIKVKKDDYLKAQEHLEEITKHLNLIDKAIRKRIHSPRQSKGVGLF